MTKRLLNIGRVGASGQQQRGVGVPEIILLTPGEVHAGEDDEPTQNLPGS